MVKLPTANHRLSRHPTNAPLEDLPPEILRHLLTFLTLDDLCRVVRASPVFHRQYLADRTFLLCSCLANTLGSAKLTYCGPSIWVDSFGTASTEMQVSQALEYCHELYFTDDSMCMEEA
ncbi:hypothetical protein F5Y13DRAFT_191065 [Hypoxylon sp. FL1857]|nr:hypothetical protein F5Y13DRAFT_191065 [Hypoxylon sp. FL1857]